MNFVFADAPPVPVPDLLETAAYTISELSDLHMVERRAQHVRYSLLNSGTISLRQMMLREYFHRALETWRTETGFSSLLEEKRAHPEYQRIVAMGGDAIPLILDEIEKRPGLIFMALHDITGEDPISPEHRGRVGEMILDWLRWGTEHGARRL